MPDPKVTIRWHFESLSQEGPLVVGWMIMDNAPGSHWLVSIPEWLLNSDRPVDFSDFRRWP